jgi:hypothetical protein
VARQFRIGKSAPVATQGGRRVCTQIEPELVAEVGWFWLHVIKGLVVVEGVVGAMRAMPVELVGNPGSAATPSTVNCVPVTPGTNAPIVVGSPGGQIVISWNPQ